MTSDRKCSSSAAGLCHRCHWAKWGRRLSGRSCSKTSEVRSNMQNIQMETIEHQIRNDLAFGKRNQSALNLMKCQKFKRTLQVDRKVPTPYTLHTPSNTSCKDRSLMARSCSLQVVWFRNLCRMGHNSIRCGRRVAIGIGLDLFEPLLDVLDVVAG